MDFIEEVMDSAMESITQAETDFLDMRAYRMLGRRLASTKRLVVSSKVWMKTIPTHNCDVLLIFPSQADDSTLMWLLARLRARTPQIVVHVRNHSNSGIYGYYMTANYENLLKGAEELGIRKHVKSEYGGGLKEFTFDEQECFAGVEDEKSFLTSQERQSIVHLLLNELRAVDGDQVANIKFRAGQPIIPLLESKKIVSQVFPLHSEEDLSTLKRSWVQAVFKKQPLDDISKYFGVKIALYFAYLGHYTMALTIPAFLGIFMCFFQGDQNVEDMSIVVFSLVNMLWATIYLEHWKRTSAELAYRWGTLDKKNELLLDPRPLYKGDLVKSYVTGNLEPHYQSWKRQLFRYCVSLPVTSLSLAVVFVVMLLIFELQEWINSHIAQNDIPSFVRFIPKILLALSIGILDEVYKKIALWLNKKENYRLEENYANHLIIKLVLFQFVNSFLSLFYIAFYLQDMDRLRDLVAHNWFNKGCGMYCSICGKVHMKDPLLLIEKSSLCNCSSLQQLATLLITRQVLSNLKEALLPYLIWKVKLLKVGLKLTGQMSPSTIDKEMTEMKEEIKEMTCRRRNVRSNDETVCTDEKSQGDVECVDAGEVDGVDVERTDDTKLMGGLPALTQAEVESAMQKYEDTYEDFLEMFIQFGYVTLFSSTFPLAALCALINNVIEIRSDAFKLCINHQRPFGKQVENIGIWQNALEVLGMIAVIVNCALIGVTGLTQRMVPSMGDQSAIVFIIVLEHLVLALKFGLAYAIPDIPEWVALEMAKIDFQRREALKRIECQNSPGVNSPDMRSRRISENEGSCSPPGSTRFSNKTPTSSKSCTQNSPTPPPRHDAIRPIKSSTCSLTLNPNRVSNTMSAFVEQRIGGGEFTRSDSETPRSETSFPEESNTPCVTSSNRSSPGSPANSGSPILSYENPTYCGISDNCQVSGESSAVAETTCDMVVGNSPLNPYDPAYVQSRLTAPKSRRRRMSGPPVTLLHVDPANFKEPGTHIFPYAPDVINNEHDRMHNRFERRRRFSSDELNRRNSWERERAYALGPVEEHKSTSSKRAASKIVFRGGSDCLPGSLKNKKSDSKSVHPKKS